VAFGIPPRVGVEHLAAVLVAATVTDLAAHHHEVDRSLVGAIHVEVDLARGVHNLDVAGEVASELALRNRHTIRPRKEGHPTLRSGYRS
jgi:hypothetical protein